MSVSEFIMLFILLAGIFYWIDTVYVKEIACQHGKDRCENLGVTFLDATVEITKVRLKRNPKGTVNFKRDYSFEFSSDGIKRYKGTISMLGKALLDLQMSAYPEISSDAVIEQANSNIVDIKQAKNASDKSKKFPTGFR